MYWSYLDDGAYVALVLFVGSEWTVVARTTEDLE